MMREAASMVVQLRPGLSAGPGLGPIRVLFVERQPVLTREARAVLARDPAFRVLGQVSSAVEATRAARVEQPHVVVCDTSLAEPGALELTRFFRVRMPQTVVLFLSIMPTDEELFQAARIGAAGYYRAGIDGASLAEAIRRAARGEYLIDEVVMRQPTVASRILSEFRQSHAGDAAPTRPTPTPGTSSRQGATFAPLFVPLSAREIEILDLVARGNSNKLIARQLGISDQTVKNHITTILRKLEVNDRTEAVVFALRNGWIRMDAPSVARR